MGSAYRKLVAGDPLNVSAKMFNELVDVARGQNFDKTGILGPRFFRQASVVKIQNNSGQDVDRFGVLGIDGTIIAPADNLSEFQRQVTFTGVTPDSSHAGKFCVLLEPLPAGDIGSAVVSGVVQVQIAGNATPQDFAEVNPTNTGTLLAGSAGSAQILWAEDNGDDPQWAIVRLGNQNLGSLIGWVQATSGIKVGLGYYNGELFDLGLSLINNSIFVRDANLYVPTQGVFYMAFRGAPLDFDDTQVWVVNVSGPVVLDVECVNGDIVPTFGAAL